MLSAGCVRQIELLEDPDVIVQLAEPVEATVWIPDPASKKMLKVVRILPAGKLVIDRRKFKRARGD